MNEIKIVIADDHGMIREGIKQLLDLEKDFNVVSLAEDGKAAINDVVTYNPDVLLLDLNMPNISGLEVLKYLKENFLNIKVIILTIHNESEYLLKALEYEVDGYILKDSESVVLKNAIRNVYNNNRFIQESLLPSLNEFITNKEKAIIKSELSKRELEVLELISQGLFNKEIAYNLSISEKTVKNHVSNIFRKINVSDRTQAAIYAIKNNIFT